MGSRDDKVKVQKVAMRPLPSLAELSSGHSNLIALTRVSETHLPTWAPWQVPADPTELDTYVASLVAHRVQPFPSPDELRSRGIACPFAFVRASLFQAAMCGADADSKGNIARARASKISHILKASQTILASSKDIALNLQTLEFGGPNPVAGPFKNYVREAESNAQKEQLLSSLSATSLPYLSALDEILKSLKAFDRPPPVERKDLWARAFAFEMGRCWTTIYQSSPPKRGGNIGAGQENAPNRFVRLLDHAFKSICSDRMNWKAAAANMTALDQTLTPSEQMSNFLHRQVPHEGYPVFTMTDLKMRLFALRDQKADLINDDEFAALVQAIDRLAIDPTSSPDIAYLTQAFADLAAKVG